VAPTTCAQGSGGFCPFATFALVRRHVRGHSVGLPPPSSPPHRPTGSQRAS
jgi:hypothetical protein